MIIIRIPDKKKTNRHTKETRSQKDLQDQTQMMLNFFTDYRFRHVSIFNRRIQDLNLDLRIVLNTENEMFQVDPWTKVNLNPNLADALGIGGYNVCQGLYQSIAASKREFNRLRYDPEIEAVNLYDSEYPDALKMSAEDVPSLLYVKGSRKLLDASKKISVITAENLAASDEMKIRKMIRFLADHQYVLVMTADTPADLRWIDVALEEQAQVIAVVSWGLQCSTVDPKTVQLLDSIVEEGGSVVSVFPLRSRTCPERKQTAYWTKSELANGVFSMADDNEQTQAAAHQLLPIGFVQTSNLDSSTDRMRTKDANIQTIQDLETFLKRMEQDWQEKTALFFDSPAFADDGTERKRHQD